MSVLPTHICNVEFASSAVDGGSGEVERRRVLRACNGVCGARPNADKWCDASHEYNLSCVCVACCGVRVIREFSRYDNILKSDLKSDKRTRWI